MPLLSRWLRFNLVGMAGTTVQLCVLSALVYGLGLPVVPATILAVEIAMQHNFAWHEAWTWKGLARRGRWRRLARFNLGNGVVSILGNTLFTFWFHESLGWSLIGCNLTAIVITGILNFALAHAWVFRKGGAMGALLLAILLLPAAAFCAVFTTQLQPGTITAWDDYIRKAESEMTGQLPQPSLGAGTKTPSLMDLDAAGDNAGKEVPSGYIHRWIGAELIPGASVADVRAVLEDYAEYPRYYAPDVRRASATALSSASGKLYNVQLILDQDQGFGLHFAFDVRSRVSFRSSGGYTLVESRSYSIRESDSAHPPYDDLLPEGSDHGILWRLNSYWRLKQSGSDVYAECQVISLSRKPLLGTVTRVKNLAKDSLRETLLKTREQAVGR